MRYIYLVFILFFSSCSYKHDNLYMSGKKITEQSVANTKKTEIMQNGKVKIFVTVTYLNSINSGDITDKNKEQFVVGFHFVNVSAKETKRDIELKNVKFGIGDKRYLVSAKKLKADSPILQLVPASNPWSQYFLVQTPKIDKNIINFYLKLKPYEEVLLKFEKNY